MNNVLKYMKLTEQYKNRKLLLEINSNGSGKLYNIKTNNILVMFETIYQLECKCKYLLDRSNNGSNKNLARNKRAFQGF